METRHEDSIKIAPLIYEIVKHSFTRDYDIVPKNIDDVIDYTKDSDTYVAYEDNIPIGYYVLKTLSKKEKELKSIAIIKNYQGKGIGKLLLAQVLEKCKNCSILLVTHPKNTAALLLYLKNGFNIVGWINDWSGDGEPRLKLMRETI